MRGGARGQSEVLSSILLAGVVTAFVALLGATVLFPMVTGGAVPVVDLGVSVTPSSVVVTHEGGDGLRAADLVVVVDGPDGESRVPVETAFSETGFEEGERVTVGGQSFNPGDTVRVQVVHRPANELLYDGRKIARFPPGLAGRRLVWSTATDWDAGSGSRIVHDDVGDRRSNRLQLGYRVGAAAPGLVSYYPLDGDGGVVAEDATGLNDGTVKDDSKADHDAYDRGVDGVFGGSAIHFSPQKEDISFEKGAYVDIGSRTASRIADGPFTWTAWVKVDREGGGKEAIVSANNADRSNNFLWFLCKPGCNAGDDSDRDATLAIHDGAFHRSSSGVVNDATWHHVAVTVEDDGTMAYYVDGSLVHTDSTGARIESDDVMSLGQDSDNADYGFGTGTSDFLEGYLDEVRIYDRALSPADIIRQSDREGEHVTGSKRFTEPVESDTLELAGVDADPNGGTITVRVEADPDGDGTFEETSDPVALSETQSTYPVTFDAAFTAAEYRLVVEMDASSGAEGPAVDRIDLQS